MAIDYYVVLGVSRGANLNKIKQAYRKIAKQFHPDGAGRAPSSEKFREITEAYETLRDTEKRRAHDSALEKQAPSAPAVPSPEDIRRQQHAYGRINPLFSATDEFFGGWVPGFIARQGVSPPAKDLYIEAVLTPAEARHGGLFPMTVPVVENCPRCSQTGRWGDFFCPVCGGSGRISGEREFSLSIPPNIRHGTRVRLSLEDIGLKNVNLHILVSVESAGPEDPWMF
jgi:DnaJ-class molecular chaperone